MPPKRSKRSADDNEDDAVAADKAVADSRDDDDGDDADDGDAFDWSDPQVVALQEAARTTAINEKLFAAPRAVAAWLRSHTVDANKALSFDRTAEPTEFWCTHVTPAAAAELSTLLKRVRVVQASVFERILCGNQNVTAVKFVCAIDADASGLAASPHLSAEDARRAGQLAISFDNEALSRVDVSFYRMSCDRGSVLEWYTPSFDDEAKVIDNDNLNALSADLGLQHASPMQLVCFFSVLAAAAMPWRTAFGETDFGSAKGCWLFPGNLCHALGMPK